MPPRIRKHPPPKPIPAFFSFFFFLLVAIIIITPSITASTSSNSNTPPLLPKFHLKPATSTTKRPSPSNSNNDKTKATTPTTPTTPTAGKWNVPSFNSFLQARTGTSVTSPVYWVLRGQLSNPFTGDVLAEVRGIEVVRLLSTVTAKTITTSTTTTSTSSTPPSTTTTSKKKTQRILPPSPSQELTGTRKSLHLPPPSSITSTPNSQWQAVATTLSAKTFKYFHPRTGQPLLTFRPSPRAKPRVVPKAVTLLQAISYALSPKGHLHMVAESTSGGLLAVQDQGTGPVVTRKPPKIISLLFPPPIPKTFELSLLMWPGSKQRGTPATGDVDASIAAGGDGGFPWSSLIQFGSSNAQPPCRELYALTTEPSTDKRQRQREKRGAKARMKYLRYGESPHWLGAGRVCHLTLEGTRYDRFQDIPREDRQLFFPSSSSKGGLFKALPFGGGGGGQRKEDDEGKGKGKGKEMMKKDVAVIPPDSARGFMEEAERATKARRKRFIFFD